MKKLSTGMFMILIVVGVSLLAHAERRPYLRATIPFAFIANNVQLPAGQYLISVVTAPGGNSDMLEIRNTYSGRYAMVRTFSAVQAAPATRTKLTFATLEGQNYLVRIWERGSGEHREIRLNKIVKELARNQLAVESTVLAGSAGR